MSAAAENDALLRVSALHALLYCERLFFLEEVEEIRLADASVYAGRTLHEELAEEEGEEQRSFFLTSETLGLTGKMDAVRHRNSNWVVYEHKRGKPMLRKGKRRRPGTATSYRRRHTRFFWRSTSRRARERPDRYHGQNTTVWSP